MNKADALNTTDEAIERSEQIIARHTKNARQLFVVIIAVCFVFLCVVLTPVVNNYFYVNEGSTEYLINPVIEKINDMHDVSEAEFDTLVTKGIAYQKLLNASEETMLMKYKVGAPVQRQNLSDYILYGVFILLFGVLTSLYRFHLREVTKQEHYLIAFQRIRIAGSNSTTGYDDEVKIALTRDAFSFNDGPVKKDGAIESPIPGYPTSDVATQVLNKVLDKVDLSPKKG